MLIGCVLIECVLIGCVDRVYINGVLMGCVCETDLLCVCCCLGRGVGAIIGVWGNHIHVPVTVVVERRR